MGRVIVKKIKPLFTALVTTADTYKEDVKEGGIVTVKAGTLMEYQKVVAVGSTVRDIEVGDLVKINPKRFAVNKRDKKSLAVDIAGNEVLSYKFDFIEIDGVLHMYLQNNDIDYVVTDYEIEKTTTSNLIVPDNKIILN